MSEQCTTAIKSSENPENALNLVYNRLEHSISQKLTDKTNRRPRARPSIPWGVLHANSSSTHMPAVPWHGMISQAFSSHFEIPCLLLQTDLLNKQAEAVTPKPFLPSTLTTIKSCTFILCIPWGGYLNCFVSDMVLQITAFQQHAAKLGNEGHQKVRAQ